MRRLASCFVLIGLLCTLGCSANSSSAQPTRSTNVVPAQTTPPAFPSAEGFGAGASGGRGGRVIYVTTLDADGPGSLREALEAAGPRYILFKVSGVIPAIADIVHGDVTIAGQTSPGGVTVRGLECDGHYERNACDNLIVRHIRSRPAQYLDDNQSVLDDALRLDGVRNFIIDHGSFANAEDEAIQVSWASQGTIQNSILAETVGDHVDYGGMLLNYSHPDHPQDNLSIHHNMWHRLGGRMPEITCEASNYPDLTGEIADCAAHPLHLELSNNLLWDVGSNIWYGPHVDADPERPPYRLELNWVNNRMVARPDFPYAMMLHDVVEVPQNALYMQGNTLNLYPNLADEQLLYCCNDFAQNNPNTDMGTAQRRTTRHSFPPITYTPSDDLQSYMIRNVGAFPRDPQDQRYLASLKTGVIDPTPRDRSAARDAFALNFDRANPPPAPIDSDNDGMPDAWEQQHGLNPNVQDHNGTELSVQLTGVAGYTNLECYLNQLADSLVSSATSSAPTSTPVPTSASILPSVGVWLPFVVR